MSELEAVSQHIHDRISAIKCVLDLSLAEAPQSKMKKLAQDIGALGRLVEEFEGCVERQREQLKQLKTLAETSQKHVEDVQHLQDNMPAHMPLKKDRENAKEAASKQEASDAPTTQAENVKKTSKRHIREMEFITMPEFDGIPQYMKGRVTYDHLNVAVKNINAAVAAKYKIVHQSARTLNNHTRKLHQRFKEQETKDTKGQYFVVEEDLREFTQTKVDKQLHGMFNMLRHCQRLRELRGGGVTRYMLL